MKTNPVNLKGKSLFEMKHRLVLSLNKLADRDTYQIGMVELEKAAESLAPEMIGPFISCIVDTDTEQKSAVRKECVRTMGLLMRCHGNFVLPHLGKMMTSIVKRLKDSDLVVRDACVDTCGVLASSVNYNGGSGVFVVLMKPLFEALGEQNRYVQSGAALCLAKVVDVGGEFHVSGLNQMLPRIIKLLKNPHFLAKPALLELIRSIIQAGGASTAHALGAALTSITDALKNSDWATRKSSSVVLASIAVNSGSFFISYKASCLSALESCKFDKVKPVRDAIAHAIQCWKSVAGTYSSEPSDAGSYAKENSFQPYHNTTWDGGLRDASSQKILPSVTSNNSVNLQKKRVPLSGRKAVTDNSITKPLKTQHWQIEIAVPKNFDVGQKRSGMDCITEAAESRECKALEEDTRYDSDVLDENPDYSSLSDQASRSYETKHVTATSEFSEHNHLTNLSAADVKIMSEEIKYGCLMNRDRNSMDSSVTDVCSLNVHGCCLRAMNELTFIKKQLHDIEVKQAHLLDLLQVHLSHSQDNMSMLQSKVTDLARAVDSAGHCEGLPRMPNPKITINESISPSSRLLMSTPRSSVGTNFNQPSLHTSPANRKLNASHFSSKSGSSASSGVVETMGDSSLSKQSAIRTPSNQSKSPAPMGTTTCSRLDDVWPFSVSVSSRKTSVAMLRPANTLSQRCNDFLEVGDAESAYIEVLDSGDEAAASELMERTGPILEKLSCETINRVLRVLTALFLEQKILSSAIPWFQQAVDLSSAEETRRLIISPEVRRQIVSALQHAETKDLIGPADRSNLLHLAMKLKKPYGLYNYRKLSVRGTKGCEVLAA